MACVSGSASSAEPVPVGAGEELKGRITLRLPETVKAAVETAADREGVSTNTWLIHTITRALHSPPTGRSRRNRLQGFAQG